MGDAAQTVLQAWEAVQHTPSVHRPAALLAALSGVSITETLRLGVARRDAALLAWRAALFGTEWRAFAQCPRCDAMLEYEMPVADDAITPPSDHILIEADGRKLSVRWPTSQDLADAADCTDRSSARSLLISRICSTPLGRDEIEAVVATLAHSHRASWNITLHCCACAYTWSVTFDPGEFLWHEIRAAARRILRQVDALARTYHWSEAEILAMSEARRNSYLEMIQ